MSNPQQDRDEAVVKLLKHLFHERFIPEEGIEPDKAGFILPTYFFGWLDKHLNLMNKEEICEQQGISHEIWSFVCDVVDTGLAVERFQQVWFAVVLGCRPAPKHALSKLNIIMLLTWTDGTIMPIQVFATLDMLAEGPGFTDGIIASLVAKNTQAFAHSIVEDGLDGLHDKGKNYRGGTPEDPFEVCMGLMLKPIKDNTLREDLKTCVEMYARLFQGIIRPILPPEVMQALEARKREWKNPGKSHGGWDA